jgi:hypothetical protein
MAVPAAPRAEHAFSNFADHGRRHERHAVSTVIVPAVSTSALDDRRPIRSMAAVFLALGYHMRIGIRTVSDLLELRFAEFAGVPYQGHLSRQQWDELWETEAQSQQPTAER